ncbi:DUF2207 domain-containing protein [Patescibacteria group bacterium]|nr:DUF2207 domain-containing protein [Patescibacteria group bacterium]
MKSKKVFLFLVILVSGFWIGEVKASEYYYDSIKVEIHINQDSTFDVVEEMTYNLDGSFGFFYRDIELKDLDHISNVEIFNSQGAELLKDQYDLGYKGNRLHIQWNFPRRDFDNELKSWTIKYKVYGGLGFFDEYDEIYWNAIFQDRDVIVDKAEVIVYWPEGINRDEIRPRIFIGKFGNKDKNGSYIIMNDSVEFVGSNILPKEYLTIVTAWPKGFIEKPFLYRNQLVNLIVIFIALIIPLIVFIKSFSLWWKKGKDPRIRKTIIASYSPPNNLSPAIIGVLGKQSVDVKDILATVIDLAVRGYLRIKEKEKKMLFIKSKEYIFEKLKNEADLKPFEQEIIRAIFKRGNTVSSTELRNKFYTELPDIKKEIYAEVAQTYLFNGNIEETRKKYGRKPLIVTMLSLVVLLGVVILLNILGLSIYSVQVVILGVGLMISFLVKLVFSYYMPTVTPQGSEAKWKALGFKEYLHTAERFRIKSETLETFSKFLPYAMIFGVEKRWAERFSDFSYQQQSWYYPATIYGGSGGMPSSFGEFSSSFSSFADSVSSTFSSTPGGSGAGGSAGGGGGGGGGGAG